MPVQVVEECMESSSEPTRDRHPAPITSNDQSIARHASQIYANVEHHEAFLDSRRRIIAGIADLISMDEVQIDLPAILAMDPNELHFIAQSLCVSDEVREMLLRAQASGQDVTRHIAFFPPDQPFEW